MIGLIMLGSIINYLTRSTLAVAAPTLLKDLNIGAQEYSWVVATFQGAIMLQPICGACARRDRVEKGLCAVCRCLVRSLAWRTR